MSKDDQKSIEKSVGSAVSVLRGMRGYTQKKFAELLSEHGLHVDSSAVSRLEKGERALKLSEVMIITEVLDVALEMLVMGILTPAQELKKARNLADVAMHSVEQDIQKWISSYPYIQELVTNNPELLAQISDELTSPDQYMPWVATRLANLEWKPWSSEKAPIVVENSDDKERLMQCVISYFDNRIKLNSEIDWEDE